MKNLRSWTLAALLCVLTAAPVFAQAGDSKQTVAGASNFVRVDANFATGGVTVPEAFVTLKQLGYRSVINLRTASEPAADLEGEAKKVGQAGLKYFGLPLSPAAPDPAIVDRFLEIVKDPANQPAYIHCLSGQRANALWMIKRVMVDGWTLEKASAEADALKVTHQGLRSFVATYLREHMK